MENIKAWERSRARELTTNTLKNYIFLNVSCGQPIPGCMSVDALRDALIERGEDGRGYHDT